MTYKFGYYINNPSVVYPIEIELNEEYIRRLDDFYQGHPAEKALECDGLSDIYYFLYYAAIESEICEGNCRFLAERWARAKYEDDDYLDIEGNIVQISNYFYFTESMYREYLEFEAMVVVVEISEEENGQ